MTTQKMRLQLPLRSKLVKLVCLKSLLRSPQSDPAETGTNNPHYRSGEGGFSGIHSMD